MGELLFGEVVPCWSVSVAEACEMIVRVWFENSEDSMDECFSVFDFNVVEAAHVENEVECPVLEGQCDETC